MNTDCRERDIHIHEIIELEGILSAIVQCDSAFDSPVLQRANSRELIEKIYQKSIFFVAEHQGPVGYAALYANNFETRVAFLTLIAVKPESQGLGVGKQLVEACIAKATEVGMSKIRLEVKKTNDKAISMYKKLGFQMTDQESVNSFFMIKVLKATQKGQIYDEH